ncbi:death domain-associated protein 6 [Rhinophrynus dorsalis]
MAQVDDIIILDDDDDDEEEETPHSSASSKSSKCPPPQTNGKKADTLSAENNKLFEEFVEYCSSITVEHPEVITFLQGKFSRANPSFLTSVEFRNILGRCLTRVQSKRSKVYVYINELCTALKANSQKRKLALRPSSHPKSPVQDGTAVNENKEEEKEDGVEELATKTGSKRQIRYLENLLRIYSREIQRLQEKELSLDELEEEDSAYIQEARLKRKIIRIFQKLCDIKDCPSLTGRVIEQRIAYRGTRYPEVNRRLEKFINSSRDGFPDYGDVLRVIQKASDKHGLGLARKQMQGMAQDAFRELGNRLQERRHLDMVYNFGCHLTDTYKNGNDPAHQDPLLARRLRENRNVAISHLDDVIKKYAEMQDDGEEEERKKKRKESETPSSSKGGQSRNRPAPSPPSQESEEDEESEEADSDTDIEEELKKCEEVSDAEEDEEQVPVDQENEADQVMENSLEIQPYSSGGEEEDEEQEVKEDEGEELQEDDSDEEGEEPLEQESSLLPTVLPACEETTTTMELEVELLPLDFSPVRNTFSSPLTDAPGSSAKGGAVSEVASSRDQTEKQQTNNNQSGDVLDEKVLSPIESQVTGNAQGEADLLSVERESPSVMDKDTHMGTYVPEGDADLPSDVRDIQADLEVPNEKESLKINAQVEPDEPIMQSEASTTHEDEESLCGSGRDGSVTQEPCVQSRSGVSTESVHTEMCMESNSGETASHVGKVTPCAESSGEVDKSAEVGSACRRSSAHSDIEVPMVVNTDVDDGAHNRGDVLQIDSSVGTGDFEHTAVSHVGSSNGVVHVTLEMQDGDSFGILQNNAKKQVKGHRNSTTVEITKGTGPSVLKRKRSTSRAILENGNRSFNGREGNMERKEKNCKRARRERSVLPVSSSSELDSDSDPSPDVSVDHMVTSSSPNSPSPPSDQRLKSHASTQCDPDEVIVLSD